MRFQKEMLETLFRDIHVGQKAQNVFAEWLDNLEVNEPAMYNSLMGMVDGGIGMLGLPYNVACSLMLCGAMFVAKAYEAQEEIEELERQFS
jgi:hypothetical protein